MTEPARELLGRILPERLIITHPDDYERISRITAEVGAELDRAGIHVTVAVQCDDLGLVERGRVLLADLTKTRTRDIVDDARARLEDTVPIDEAWPQP